MARTASSSLRTTASPPTIRPNNWPPAGPGCSTASLPASVHLLQKPRDRGARNLGRDAMRPVEFLELHVVSAPLELRDEPPAALLDRQDLVTCPMRHEDAWPAARFRT